MKHNMDELTTIRHTYEQAQLQGVCDKFTGKEKDFEQMARLLFSVQGIEFCATHQSPDMTVWREYKELGADKYNVYIDAGDIELTDVRYAAIVGNTKCKLTMTGNNACTLLFLHGAKAEITLNDFSVAFTHGAAADDYKIINNGHGRVLHWHKRK